VIGIGCLAPLILFIVGAFIGQVLIGTSGVPWGAGVGFVLGLVLLVLIGWAIGKTKRR